MTASKIIAFILGILMIGIGIYVLTVPGIVPLTLGWFIAINMIIDAIAGIIIWNEHRKAGASSGFELAAAIISLIFGLILICNGALQLFVDVVFIYIAAIMFVVIGIIRIVLSIKARKLKDGSGKLWWLALIVGILMVICGIISFFNPLGLAIAIGITFGLNIIFAGTDLIFLALAV